MIHELSIKDFGCLPELVRGGTGHNLNIVSKNR